MRRSAHPALGDVAVVRGREVAQRSGGRSGQLGMGRGRPRPAARPARRSGRSTAGRRARTPRAAWRPWPWSSRPASRATCMAAGSPQPPTSMRPAPHAPTAVTRTTARTADCAAGACPATRTRSSRPAPSGRRRASPSDARVSASTVDRHGRLRAPAGGGVPVSGRPGRVPAALAGAQRTRVAGAPLASGAGRDPGQLCPDEAGQLHGTARAEVDRVEEPGVPARAVAVPRRHPQQR